MSYPGSDSDNEQEARSGHDQVWRSVRVTIHCQSRGFSQLVTIVDPVSRWMFAEIIPVGCDNIAYFVANFMFKTFCCFGFPNVELFNVNSIQFEMVEQEYNQMISQANEMIPNLNLCPGEMTLKPNEDSQQSLDVSSHLLAPNQVSTSIWLLSLRLKQNEAGVTPFQMVFSRKFSEKTLPDLELKQTRRKLQSSVLHCRHCEESFTSKISFRIHQRRHTEEARLRGQREGEAPFKKLEDGDGDDKEVADKAESSTSPIKISSKKRLGYGRNKLQRRKRLMKLAEKWSNNDNVIDEIVQEEVSENAAEAVCQLLRATRDERQRRGKYVKLDADMRDEIAEYAILHGQAAAAQVYSNKLNAIVAESSVRNFVQDFQNFPQQLRMEIGSYAGECGLEVAARVYSAKLGQEVTQNMVKRFRKQFSEVNEGGGELDVRGTKSGQLYSQELREEIGRYAGIHGVQATVQVYSDKLLFSVKPSTVRKFRQLYGNSRQENLSYIQLSESSSTTIDLLHSSLDVLNPHSSSYLTNETGNQPMLITNYQLQDKSNPSLHEINGASLITKSSTPTKRKNKQKIKDPKQSRGRYVQYSDELRAKIGKFALRHGNSAAMKHFHAELGHEIPESTIRGMRDKYQLLLEREGDSVAKVGCGPRGRPTSLGHYDTMVQAAVRKLQEKGEKITTFVVIAVAKQVISQQEPDLLHDAGGHVKLNTTWAKSMLRRLGIRNKST